MLTLKRKKKHVTLLHQTYYWFKHSDIGNCYLSNKTTRTIQVLNYSEMREKYCNSLKLQSIWFSVLWVNWFRAAWDSTEGLGSIELVQRACWKWRIDLTSLCKSAKQGAAGEASAERIGAQKRPMEEQVIPCSPWAPCKADLPVQPQRSSWCSSVWGLKAAAHGFSHRSSPGQSCSPRKAACGGTGGLGELQPVGSPCAISWGRMASCGRDPTWSRGREWLWRNGKDEALWADRNSHSLQGNSLAQVAQRSWEVSILGDIRNLTEMGSVMANSVRIPLRAGGVWLGSLQGSLPTSKISVILWNNSTVTTCWKCTTSMKAGIIIAFPEENCTAMNLKAPLTMEVNVAFLAWKSKGFL